jgi:hypothetical protein
MAEKWTKDTTTIGDMYHPAMAITDQAEADAYFERLVEYSMREWGKSREEAEQTQKSNLGYFAGYYDSETRERVERLFHCSHPVFGSIAEKGAPTPEEALEAGKRMARAIS